MATNTTNYGWTKPEYEDDADVMVINDTIDDIDEEMYKKQDKEAGKGLSSNDYTTAEKEKLAGLSNTALLGLGTSIPSGADLNNYTTPGIYFASSSAISQAISNNPASTPFKLTVEEINSAGRVCQTIIPTNIAGGIIYTRLYTNNGWQSWYKFTGEVVT